MRSAADFDFDYWADLARRDPQRFEAERLRVLDAAISRASPGFRRRLQGLQFQLDMERRRAKTPLAACIRFSELMLDTVHGELLPLLHRLAGGGFEGPAPRPGVEARILRFPGRPREER